MATISFCRKWGLWQGNIPVGAFGPSGGFGLDETRRALYSGPAD